MESLEIENLRPNQNPFRTEIVPRVKDSRDYELFLPFWEFNLKHVHRFWREIERLAE